MHKHIRTAPSPVIPLGWTSFTFYCQPLWPLLYDLTYSRYLLWLQIGAEEFCEASILCPAAIIGQIGVHSVNIFAV